MMESVPGMHLEQSKEAMHNFQCVHSKAAGSFFSNWDDHWIIDDLDVADLSYRIQTFLGEGRFLSAIQINGQVTLTFTVERKQRFPLCSNITAQNKQNVYATENTKRSWRKMKMIVTQTIIGIEEVDRNLPW